MSDVRGNILSAIVKNGAKIDLTREGLYGVDLCREGKIFTEWPRIGKIIVDREEVTLIERSSTLVKDENGMIQVHYYVDPAELLSRKNSDLRDGQGKKVFNDKPCSINKTARNSLGNEKQIFKLCKDVNKLILKIQKLKDIGVYHNKSFDEGINNHIKETPKTTKVLCNKA